MSNKKQVMPLRQLIAQDKKLAKQLASQNGTGQQGLVSDESSRLADRFYLNYDYGKKLSEMFHSEDQTFSQITNFIQKVLNEHPANVLVLASLIGLERIREKSKLEKEIDKKLSESRSRKAKNAANARHEQPGGSHAKRAEIVAIWKSGKYKTKTKCATDECGNIGMSYNTAIKALRESKHKTKAT